MAGRLRRHVAARSDAPSASRNGAPGSAGCNARSHTRSRSRARTRAHIRVIGIVLAFVLAGALPAAVPHAHADDDAFAVTATLTLDAPTIELALAPDGSRVWVVNGEGDHGTVTLVDLHSDSLLAEFPVNKPTLVATDQDGAHAYVACSDADGKPALSIFDDLTDTVMGTVRLPVEPVALWASDDGRHVLVLHPDATVSLVSVPAMEITKTIPAPQPSDVEGRFIRDHKKDSVYVARFGVDDFSMSTHTGDITDSLHIPENMRLLFIDDDPVIYMIEGKLGEPPKAVHAWDRKQQAIVSTLPMEDEIAPKIDGSLRRIYTASTTKPRIIVRNLDTHDPLTTIAIAEPGEGLRISADGSRLVAFNRNSSTISVITAPPTVAATPGGAQSDSRGVPGPTVTPDSDGVGAQSGNGDSAPWNDSPELGWITIGLAGLAAVLAAGGVFAHRSANKQKDTPTDAT